MRIKYGAFFYKDIIRDHATAILTPKGEFRYRHCHIQSIHHRYKLAYT